MVVLENADSFKAYLSRTPPGCQAVLNIPSPTITAFGLVGKKVGLWCYCPQRLPWWKVGSLQDVMEDKYPKWEIATYDALMTVSGVGNGTGYLPWYTLYQAVGGSESLGMDLVVVTAALLLPLLLKGVSDSANPAAYWVISQIHCQRREGYMD